MDEEKLITDIEAILTTAPVPPIAMASGADAREAVVDAAMQPGKPLDAVIKIVRRAPLQSVAVAFLLGMAFARRR